MKKTIFMITILVCAMIPLNGISANAEADVCCERTLSGDYCAYTDAKNCDPKYRSVSSTCEQTSYCELGCCTSKEEGRCFKSTPRAICQNKENAIWTSSADCDIPQCQKGCCVIGRECSYVTQTRCKLETSSFENVSMSFDESLNSEMVCLDKCKSLEKGACVRTDGTCEFTTRESCNTQLGQGKNETAVAGFHNGALCSNEELGTDCAPMAYTGCVDEDVYWFDSCGNPENIYDSNKARAYNHGRVLGEAESCNAKGPNDPDCGNCDYSLGTLCGKADRKNQPEYGEFACKSLDCPSTYQDKASPNSGGDKKHGESWCLYDAKVGHGKDLVGSRHYRHLCIAGEEMVEECKDYREEMCIQGVIGSEPLETSEALGLTSDLGSRGDYVEARCRENRWKDCDKCNTADFEGIANIDDYNKFKHDLQEDFECCTRTDLRDCYWLGGKTDQPNEMNKAFPGKCVPTVPPGLKFFGEITSNNVEGNSTTKPETETKEISEAASVCEQASVECEVEFVSGGWTSILGKLGIKAGGISKEWTCVKNCHCLEKDWILAQNNICKAQGDCGAYYNIKGKYDTTYNVDVKKEFVKGFVYEDFLLKDRSVWKENKKRVGLGITRSEIENWNSVLQYPKKPQEQPGLYKEFQHKGGWLVLGAMAGFGIYGWKYGGGSFWKGVSGVFPTMVKKVFSLGGLFRSGTAVPKTMAETSKAAYVKGTEGSGTFASTLNTIMWIYTIYQVVEVAGKGDEKIKLHVSCNPYEAPDGGKDCYLCNEKWKTCSEYRCKSLGKTCGIVNAGTAEESCVDIHPNDVTSPKITPMRNALTAGFDLKATQIGYTITPKIPAYTPIRFGINTDEPAQCKISLNSSVRYDQMPDIYLGDSLYKLNHTIEFSLSSELAKPEILKLTNGGSYTSYIRCKDASGNANEKDYYIKFSIDRGPDMTPPTIEVLGIKNGAYMPAGGNITKFSMYVNEPVECKWDYSDREYENMNNTFECAGHELDISSVYYGLYECKTRLGIKDNSENAYYFRCKDQPGAPENKRNVNSESYRFKLIGTVPLVMGEVSPRGEILDLNPILRVVTSKGAENGKAYCGYSEEDVEIRSMTTFLNTNGTIHEQPFNLTKGDYKYYIGCIDVAGNQVKNMTSFFVTADTEPPKIVNIYKDSDLGLLHVEMDEKSTCEYSVEGKFNYGEGKQMLGTETFIHEGSLEVGVEAYYIVCADLYKNIAKFTVYTDVI